VVVEWPERILRIVGEILTPELLTRENAMDVWLPESRLEGVAFYLYVPMGYLDDARKLLKEAGIRRMDVTLRTWRHQPGLKRIDIAMFN
jgi:hypothetical protein